ncbi:unnamed protein product [Ambrosiozyma monospora]|uniref:Unnamed protein product n=1 Tax=Ambrosiozyma monospora TaxID=43982 RepID=A0A9W7DFR8_AMBMO|nr:unnamed protein product [Ambrosiozyma monospora]
MGLKHAVFLHNIQVNKGSSVYGRFHGREYNSDPNKLIPFGSRVFVRNNNNIQKINKSFKASIFLGYDNTLKIINYLNGNLATGRIARTADFSADGMIYFPYSHRSKDMHIFEDDTPDPYVGTGYSGVFSGGSSGFVNSDSAVVGPDTVDGSSPDNEVEMAFVPATPGPSPDLNPSGAALIVPNDAFMEVDHLGLPSPVQEPAVGIPNDTAGTQGARARPVATIEDFVLDESVASPLVEESTDDDISIDDDDDENGRVLMPPLHLARVNHERLVVLRSEKNIPPEYVPSNNPVSHDLVLYDPSAANDVIHKQRKRNDGSRELVVYEKLPPTNVNDSQSLPHPVRRLLGNDDETTLLSVHNDVYDLVKQEDAPAGTKIIPGRYVSNVKIDTDKQELFKVRMVAKGYLQHLNEIYLDKFAPVSSFDSLRFLLVYAAMNNFAMTQVDVKTAFLNGKLKIPVYFSPPEGSCTDTPEYVWKLNRSLYGTAFASKAWCDEFSAALLEFGFEVSKIDPCLFFKESCLFLIYVDDGICTASNQGMIDEVILFLNTKFEMKNLGSPSVFLAINIDKVKNGIHISMRDSIDKLKLKGCL